MDTGLSAALEDVITRHPGWMIGQNAETSRWEAIRHPRPNTEVFIHATTLAELDAAISEEPS